MQSECMSRISSLLQECTDCSATGISCAVRGKCLSLVCVAILRRPKRRTACAGSSQAAVRWRGSLACSGLPAGLQRPNRSQGCCWGAPRVCTGQCSLCAMRSSAASCCSGAWRLWGRICGGFQPRQAAWLRLPTHEARALSLLLGAERDRTGYSTAPDGARSSALTSVTAWCLQLLWHTIRCVIGLELWAQQCRPPAMAVLTCAAVDLRCGAASAPWRNRVMGACTRHLAAA